MEPTQLKSSERKWNTKLHVGTGHPARLGADVPIDSGPTYYYAKFGKYCTPFSDPWKKNI